MDCKNIRDQIEEKIQSGFIDEAGNLFLEYKKVCEESDDFYSIEAIINIYKNKLDEALISIRKGLKFNLFNGDLYFTMGNIYELLGEYNRAFLCYEHALEFTNDEKTYQIIENAKENLLSNYIVKVNDYSIVMLTYNNLEYTQICVDSIRKYNKNYELIIIDNNSTDGTVEWIKSQKDIKYILNNENKGFPAGCNQGIEISNKGNDIFLLNNDTVIMPNSIFNLRMGLYSNDKIGATGAISNSVPYHQQVDLEYDSFDDYLKFSVLNNILDEEKYEQRIMLVGFAMFIRREALDKVGELDERFSPGNYEDNDISLRLITQGYDLLLCKDCYIHHFGSISFKKDKAKYNTLLKNNSIKFKEKWGFNHKKLYISKEIIDLIDENKDKHLNVLQIGCGCGATLFEIKNRYRNSNVYGVESNREAAQIAKQYFNVSIQNIENSQLKFQKNYFDYIILSEEVGKFYNPEDVLKNIREYLKEDGYIVASIDNVMNYNIIRSLINGSWSYTNDGIMKRENIRYFAKGDIINILSKSAYDNIWIRGIKGEKSKEDEAFIDEISGMSKLGLRDEFEYIMYFVKAKRGEDIYEKTKRKCMLILRNLEFGIDIEKREKEFQRILNKDYFSEDLIINVINEGIVNKIKMFNYVAIKCLESEKINMSILLLKKAYELDNEDVNTNYNLAYMSNMCGQKKLALEYLDKLDLNDLRVKELMGIIKGDNGE